jgi:hypothetical protein
MDSQPTRPFQDPREVLEAHLVRIVDGVANHLEQTAIIYRVSGGPPGKRLSMALRVSAAGETTYEAVDQLKAQKTIRSKTTLPGSEAMSLFRQVKESGLLGSQDTGKGFLPDSVIGSITVESRDAHITYYFLADEHQQKSQGKEPPPPIQRLKPLLDSVCEVVQKASRARKPH